MWLPLANAAAEAEAQRLARCYDLVEQVLAGAAGLPWDERQAASDEQGWTFSGGALSVTWADDDTRWGGGALSEEETIERGSARIRLWPVAEHDDLQLRRARVKLQLRELRDRGSALAAENATLDLGPSAEFGLGAIRSVFPDGDGDGLAATLTVPFALRLQIQTLAPPEDEEMTADDGVVVRRG